MTYNKKERLMLVNQYLILEKLYPEGGYDKKRIILENGYITEYYQIDDSIQPEMSEDDCHFVSSVLNMYENIHFSNIKRNYQIQNTEFLGFYGNEESKYLQYAAFLIDDDERYSCFKRDGGYDSHFPLKSKYKKMLAKWEPMYNESLNCCLGLDSLSKEEIEDLLNTY